MLSEKGTRQPSPLLGRFYLFSEDASTRHLPSAGMSLLMSQPQNVAGYWVLFTQRGLSVTHIRHRAESAPRTEIKSVFNIERSPLLGCKFFSVKLPIPLRVE